MKNTLKKYEILICNEWCPVRGYVNEKGWLVWMDANGLQGMKKPGDFVEKRRSKKRTNP